MQAGDPTSHQGPKTGSQTTAFFAYFRRILFTFRAQLIKLRVGLLPLVNNPVLLNISFQRFGQ